MSHSPSVAGRGSSADLPGCQEGGSGSGGSCSRDAARGTGRRRLMKSDWHHRRLAAGIARLRTRRQRDSPREVESDEDDDDEFFRADVRVCVGASTFSCHRFVLALSSESLRRQLCNEQASAVDADSASAAACIEGRKIKLEGISADVFDKVLDFLYTGTAELTTDSVLDVLTAASSPTLCLPDLASLCVDFMLTALGADNCVRYWTFAQSAIAHGDIEDAKSAAVSRTASVESIAGSAIAMGEPGASDVQTGSVAGDQVARLVDACCQLVQTEFEALTFRPDFGELTPLMIKEVLNGSKLGVRTEVDVCEMLIRWLDAQQSCRPDRRRPAVQPDQLLTYIRWSGVHSDYVRSVLMSHEAVTSHPEAVEFLRRVLGYLDTGVQFYGLRTFHRPSTGVERCLMAFGSGEGISGCNQSVYRIHLQLPETPVTVLDRGPSNSLSAWPLLQRESAACVSGTTVYVSGLGRQCAELWTWTVSAGWTRCGDLAVGRSRHGVCYVGGRMYALGGLHRGTTVASVEYYDPMSNTCRLTHKSLVRPAKCFACVAHRAAIYVFGGLDDKERAQADIQVYDTARDVCSVLVGRSMPRPVGYARAVIYGSSVIVFSRRTCLVYDVDAEKWTERRRFGTGVRQFGLAVENGRVYVAGGGASETGTFGAVKFTTTDEVKSLAVSGVLYGGQIPVWTQHARLPRPGIVSAYGIITLPLVQSNRHSAQSTSATKR